MQGLKRRLRIKTLRSSYKSGRRYIQSVTDLITAVVRLLRRDMNGLVKTALGELELVKP